MIRMLIPWRGLPRSLPEWEWDFPGLMGRFVEQEPFEDGMKFIPEVNIIETDRAVEVTLDLPGMKPEQVNLEFHHGQLFVSGEKREEKGAKGKKIHRVERRSGSFRRLIEIPSAVDEAKIEAIFTEGVLKVMLPKIGEAMGPQSRH